MLNLRIGKRSDIADAVDAIHAGSTIKQLAVTHGVAVVKYFKGFTVLRSLVRPPREGPPVIVWVCGPTGTGKTRSVFESARSLCGHDDADIWISSGSLRWFAGYDGQSVAIFDDFRAVHVDFPFLLRLTDRYPVSVEFKGGEVQFGPKYIFFTCPYDIDECFVTRKAKRPEDVGQFHRRVTGKFKFTGRQSSSQRQAFCDAVAALVPRDDGGDEDLVDEQPTGRDDSWESVDLNGY